MPHLISLPPHVFAAGTVAGTRSVQQAVTSGQDAGLSAGADVAVSPTDLKHRPDPITNELAWPVFPPPHGREFVDLDEDVTCLL